MKRRNLEATRELRSLFTADGVLIIVMGGETDSLWAFEGHSTLERAIPDVLEHIANQVRADLLEAEIPKNLRRRA